MQFVLEVGIKSSQARVLAWWMPPCRTRLRLRWASIKVLCIFASRKAVNALNVVTEPTGWVAKCSRTDVLRRTGALAPTGWWCPCEVACTAMRRERHCFLSLYSSGEENHLQPLGVCSLEPAWFSSSAAMLHLTCGQVLSWQISVESRQSWFIVVAAASFVAGGTL